MSTAEILKELPTLNQDDRQEILNRLCDLQERDLLSGRGPSAELRKLLDEELEDFERTGDRGTPWDDFVEELRKPDPQ